MSEDMTITNTMNEVSDLTHNVLCELLEKWKLMFTLSDGFKNARFNQFVSHLRDFYNEMLDCEENRMNNYMKEVENKLKECNELGKALNVTIDSDISCSDKPLTEVIKHLEESRKKFETLKLKRIVKLERLRNKENDLRRLLGFDCLNLSNTIPSDEDMERLEHYIFIMEEEKIKRTKQFQNCRDNIVGYIKKLEISTLPGFEEFLINNEGVASLTAQDLDSIKDVENTYKDQYEAAKVKIEYLLEKLDTLWNRLDIDSEYRNAFSQKHFGLGRKTTQNIHLEIQRCEKLRHDLIETLIKKTKNQISDLCKKLCYSEQQIARYTVYDKTHIAEDVLDCLELDLEKLKYLFNENSNILEVAKKHQNMWERMLELQEAAKDKQRLFNNRGGQLLREEKERKTIQQSLPKLHKRLEDLLVDYEDRKGVPFLYYGENLLAKISKENELQILSKQNKVISNKNESKLWDSASKVKEKRKILTPKFENSKRLKLSTSTSLTSSASKTSSIKSVDGRCSRSRVALFKDQDTSVASSYSMFQEEIEGKKRPTTLSNSGRQPLKDVNSPTLPFHSSSRRDIDTPKFNFRPRAAKFCAKSAIPTSKNPTKHTFVTPKTSTRYLNRTITPRRGAGGSIYTPRKTPTHKPKAFSGLLTPVQKVLRS